MAEKKQRCTECGKLMPRGSTKVCSDACRQSRDLRWKKKSREKALEAEHSKRPMIECYICGRVVRQRNVKQKTCGDRSCHLQHVKLTRRELPTTTISCYICGATVTIKQGDKTTICQKRQCYLTDRNNRLSKNKWFGSDFKTMSTNVTGLTWACAEMDPMTNHMEPGVWVSVAQQQKQQQEEAE